MEVAGADPVGGAFVAWERLAIVMTSAVGAPVRRSDTLVFFGDTTLLVGGAVAFSLWIAFTSFDVPSSYSSPFNRFLYASSLFPILCRELHPICMPFYVDPIITVIYFSNSAMLDCSVAIDSGVDAA